MRSEAKTVSGYLASLPAEQRAEIDAVRKTVLASLPAGYVETMNWGMIAYEVPLAISGRTYNGKPLMYVALGAQKNHLALYLCGLYPNPALKKRFVATFAKSGRKLDMGASCVRFRKAADLDLAAVGEAVGAVKPDAFAKTAAAAPKKKR